MLSRFSSSHIPRRVPAPLLGSCDHFAAEFLYARDRPGRHRLNPWLHPQRGLRKRKKRNFMTRCKRIAQDDARVAARDQRRRHFDCSEYPRGGSAVLSLSFCERRRDETKYNNEKERERDGRRGIDDARFATHRMCWDSGWTYDKQKRSLGWYITAERRCWSWCWTRQTTLERCKDTAENGERIDETKRDGRVRSRK